MSCHFACTVLICVTLFNVVEYMFLSVHIHAFVPPLYSTYTSFAVFGEGLSGKATYSFELVFCEPISTEVREKDHRIAGKYLQEIKFADCMLFFHHFALHMHMC